MKKKNKFLYRTIVSIAFISVATSSIVIPIDIVKNKNSLKKISSARIEDESLSSNPNINNDITNPFIELDNSVKAEEEILDSENKESNDITEEINNLQIIDNTEIVQKTPEEELWEEFEEQINNPISNDKYSKSQIRLIELINKIQLRDDFYNSTFFEENPELKEVWRQYFIDSALIILDDITKINKSDFVQLEYTKISKNFWVEIIKDYHEIREGLFIELSQAYNNNKNNSEVNNQELKNHISFLCKKITNIEAKNLIWVSEEIEKEIKGFSKSKLGLINNSLTKNNKTYELVWELISKLLSLVSEQTFFQESEKQKLGTEELSNVLFSNLISSAGPLIVDFLLNNLNDILAVKDNNEQATEDSFSSNSNNPDLKQYVNFIYKILNGKANYNDIEHIIPKNIIEGIPQSFYGIAFNTFSSLIGNPFNTSGPSIKEINLSLFKRIFSVFDLVNSVIDINSIIQKTGSINTSYFFDWINKQEEVIQSQGKRDQELSDYILPILELFDKFLSGRLELANYDNNSQDKSLNILLDSTFKVLSQLNVVDYKPDNSQDGKIPGLDKTLYFINNVKEEKIKNVLSDTFIFIKSLSSDIYKFNSFSSIDNNKLGQLNSNLSILDICNDIVDYDYSVCLLKIHEDFKKLGIHKDQIEDSNVKFAKSYIKSFAMNKINSFDSSYSLVYKDIKDENGEDISFVQNYVEKKQKLITSIFVSLYGKDSKYLESYITMNEGLYILPGSEYKSLSPILSSTLMSFDNYLSSEDFSIQNLINDYTPIVNIFVDMLKNIMDNDPVAGTLISSLFDMIVGSIKPSQLLNNLSKVIPGIPWIPNFIIDLLAKDFEKWIKSKNTYLDKFKNIFTQLAKLLTIKDKIFCSGIPVGSGYWYKAENAFSSAGIYKYFNISATYNRQQTGCWFFHRPSDIYSSTKFDPFSMIDNYVINKLVSTTNITEKDASNVLEDILYQLIGKGLNKLIPGYNRPSF